MRIVQRTIVAGLISALIPTTGLLPHVVTAVVSVSRAAVRAVGELTHRETSDFTEAGVRIRSAPRLDGEVGGIGSPGDSVVLHERIVGEAVTCPDGKRNSTWRRIDNERTDITGFVSSCYL